MNDLERAAALVEGYGHVWNGRGRNRMHRGDQYNAKDQFAEAKTEYDGAANAYSAAVVLYDVALDLHNRFVNELV